MNRKKIRDVADSWIISYIYNCYKTYQASFKKKENCSEFILSLIMSLIT